MTKLLTVALLLIASRVSAQDKKISALPSGSPLQAMDMLPIARAGDNFSLAGSEFLSSAGGTLTGVLKFPDGSSSAPSIAFASSPAAQHAPEQVARLLRGPRASLRSGRRRVARRGA